MNYPSFLQFFCIINGITVLWTTTVLTDKLNISLRPSKSTGQTQHDVLRDVSYNFSLVYDLFSDHNTCLFVHNDVFTTYTIIFSANRVTKITQNDKSRDHFHIRIAGIN